MRQEHAEDLYVLYDLFIDTFLFKGNSILSDQEFFVQLNFPLSFFI